ncbi:unnamed protein product [Pleuronectes platessa]|uniref:Uncharacterized protein n=1 Tax=Pleuronectes platessa TaxID=8262 RepID=A0A9N7ZDV5_PLEPL|nr:unnamed protein product [Pleuronectes platessa]
MGVDGSQLLASGDLEEYRKSRYVFRSAISSAKRLHRDKVESHYKGSNTRNIGWDQLTSPHRKPPDRTVSPPLPLSLVPHIISLLTLSRLHRRKVSNAPKVAMVDLVMADSISCWLIVVGMTDPLSRWSEIMVVDHGRGGA